MTGRGPTGLADAAGRWAERRPVEPALVAPGVRWTWAELDRRIASAVIDLLGAGVRPGDRVALLARTTPEAIVALHALARLGAVAAPLGTRLTRTELAALGRTIRPALLLYDAAAADRASAVGATLYPLEAAAGPLAPPDATRGTDAGVWRPGADASGWTQGADSGAWHDASRPARLDGGGAVAIATSGTTDRPKVALLSAAALGASATAWMAALPPASGWLLALGLAHVAGIGVVWRAAIAGVPLVLADPEPDALRAALTAPPAPSHLSLVPTQLERLLDADPAPPPASVRALLLGGGAIAPELVGRVLSAGWPVVPTYGLTEAGSGVAALPTAEAAEAPGSAGRPLPGVEVTIDEPAHDGVGEILVLTPARFEGYLDDPEGTAAALTPDGRLRTGDLGRLDAAGRLIVVDRRTDLIVSGGENVAPAEVEAVLLGHPAIAEAGVVGNPDPTWGSVPVAAIVVRPGIGDPDDEALRRWCRERLAPYKIPAAFVRVETLPRTPSGKLKRRRLRQRLAEMGGPR